MIPGQKLMLWFQELVLGRVRSPQDLMRAARAEVPDAARSSLRFLDIPDDVGWHAPQRLQAPAFILGEAHLKQGHKADWQQTDVRLQRWAAVFIEMARKQGIPLYVHCAFRTRAEQAKVNSQGNSKAAWPRSAHNIGEAVDIVHGVYHWSLTKQEWDLLHVLGQRALEVVNGQLPVKAKLALTWGGTFKSLYDPAHWEIADYRVRIRPVEEGEAKRLMPRKILATVKL